MSRLPDLHRWDVTPEEARDLQVRLSMLVECEDRLDEPALVRAPARDAR